MLCHSHDKCIHGYIVIANNPPIQKSRGPRHSHHREPRPHFFRPGSRSSTSKSLLCSTRSSSTLSRWVVRLCRFHERIDLALSFASRGISEKSHSFRPTKRPNGVFSGCCISAFRHRIRPLPAHVRPASPHAHRPKPCCGRCTHPCVIRRPLKPSKKWLCYLKLDCYAVSNECSATESSGSANCARRSDSQFLVFAAQQLLF